MEARKRLAAMAAAEVQYEALQALLMEQLGIKEGDIVDVPSAAAPAPLAAAGTTVAFGRGGAPAGKADAAPAPAAKKAPPAPVAAGGAAKGKK